MAAGVSLTTCLLGQILVLTLFTFTIAAVDEHHNYVAGNENSFWSPELQVELLSHQNFGRFRRQADPDTSNDDNSQTTGSAQDSDAVTSTTTTTTTTTTAPPVQDTTSASTPPESTVPPSTTTTTPDPRTTTRPIVVPVNHDYYTVSVHQNSADHYWISEEVLDATGKQTHGVLSNSHRTAATIKLSFKFLFYGHEVNQVTIATGGFIYTSSFVHQWLTATQYVAPLMANFDTRLGNNSQVHYRDNGTALTVWWQDLHVKDHPEEGNFSFQASLHDDGHVIFTYRSVAMNVPDLSTKNHPVKVGMSDAYYYDERVQGKTGAYTKRTIYEYHKVTVEQQDVNPYTVVIINPKPTCISLSNCTECVTVKTEFTCQWCNKLKRCSSGTDRKRQEWRKNGCHNSKSSAETVAECAAGGSGSHTITIGAIVAIIVLLSIVFLVVAWILYAYKNPQSKSGIWLIEHRPSQLKAKLSKVQFWKRGDSGDKYQVSMQPDGESVA